MVKKLGRIFTVTLAVLLAISVAFYVYAAGYYRADREKTDGFMSDMPIEKRELNGDAVAYIPPTYSEGVIFYPGGKVDPIAYEPLMKALAARGVLAVLVKMPHNLAVLKSNAADGIREQLPGVDSWYMAGHSLGGSMAASYLSKNAGEFDGLILLAAYSTADLSDKGARVLSIYGSLDGVMNREKYAEYFSNLPSDTEEMVIDGANHAGFGMYGAQKGDGTATLTNEEQIDITVNVILNFIR